MKNSTGQLFGGSWTEQKLEILKKYLQTYTQALKNQPFRKVYIDAFAGTGYRLQRKNEYNIQGVFEELEDAESANFLKGSAKLALETNPPFHRYIFIESDQSKISQLQKLCTQHPEKVKQVQIVQSDANEFIQSYCVRENWAKTRAVLFLDPFATEVEWATIEAIAQTRCIDVWILFPLMAINRLLANDPEKVHYKVLNQLFGTTAWFRSFYQTEKLDDIFGQSFEIVKKACNFATIAEFYKNRLKKIFSGVAPHNKVFYNSRGSALFQLYFAAANPNGARIAIPIADHLLRNI